ncbi:FAD-dependent oxidoreductase [Microbispora sp. H10949]|uniref:FAD-dependent oxidoreductase n=1 Tax=Microbispora sp. H10949 TaxID=2729111 RepID=UPI0015FFF862|nr:FAD-dependent oxidoreductase [Microbispora sp. H10949]
MPVDVGEAQLHAGMRPFFGDDDAHALGSAGQVGNAGEHTQMDHFGYMEGAIRSGEWAARLLLDQL